MKSLKNGDNFEDMIQEYIRSELEKAINMFLKEELTGLLDYEKYDKSGYNIGNSRTTISNITKKVVANIEAFRNRKLKNDYAVAPTESAAI